MWSQSAIYNLGIRINAVDYCLVLAGGKEEKVLEKGCSSTPSRIHLSSLTIFDNPAISCFTRLMPASFPHSSSGTFRAQGTSLRPDEIKQILINYGSCLSFVGYNEGRDYYPLLCHNKIESRNIEG